MKRLLLFLLLPLCVSAQTVGAHANGDNATGSTVSSIATSTTLNLASGKTLKVGCHSFDNPTTMTPSDTAGNTFTPSPDGMKNNGGNDYLEMFYVNNATANAADTVTCTFAVAVRFVAVDAGIIDCGAPGCALDTHAFGTGASPLSSGTFTTTAAVGVVEADVVTNTTGNTFTAGTNFTIQNTEPGGVGADETWTTSSTQTGVTASISWGGAGGTLEVLTFKQASAAPQPGTVLAGPAKMAGPAVRH